MAKVCAASAGRMIPFCTVSLYRKDAAVAEFCRCIEALNMRGLKIHPWVQGESINTDVVDELCEMAAYWNIPLLFHDGNAMLLATFASGHSGPAASKHHNDFRALWTL